MSKIIAKSRNGKMLKIGTDEKDATWYFLAESVVKFVETGIKIGDEVTIKYNQSGGKATINYITKGKGESQQSKPASTETKSTGFTCEECGAELKDGKYKKCYTCNQKKKVGGYDKSSPTETKINEYFCEDCGAKLKDDKYKKCYTCNQKKPVGGYDKPATGTSKDNLIKREAIGHMVSRSLISLQGHVEPNNIHSLIKEIYATYLKLIDEK